MDMTLWLVTPHTENQKANPNLVLWRERINLDKEPCRTIGAENVGGLGYYWLEDDGRMTEQTDTGKPPYHVPSMAEIEATSWNGYNVVSTFSGAGGSCLGYRMAGFKVLWASEFIPAAQEVYRLNHPNTILDTRDIRTVQPQEILDSIGLRKGEIDLLDGSPPCASFSTAGKREEGWGKVKKYSDTTQRVDDLFFEYARILEGLQPKTFVAENVSRLVKGKAKGYFKEILQALKDCGYNVKAKLLDAKWLGVPQSRQRLIFEGVRKDLRLSPAYPRPLPYLYTVRDALPWIVRQGDNGGFGKGGMQDATVPSGTVGVSPQTGNGKFPPSLVEARVIHDESGQWSQGDITDSPSPAVRQGRHHLFVEQESDISRFAIGREWDKLQQGEQSKKYFNLVRAHLDKPSPAVTQSAGTAWSPAAAAGVTHPTERRKFSIAELKRICAFPDDFQLTGTYAQQWERLGRAVPPIMMKWIAQAMRDEVLCKIN